MEQAPDVGGPQDAEDLGELRRDEIGAREDGDIMAVCGGYGRVQVRRKQIVSDRDNGDARLQAGARAIGLASEGGVDRLAGEG